MSGGCWKIGESSETVGWGGGDAGWDVGLEVWDGDDGDDGVLREIRRVLPLRPMKTSFSCLTKGEFGCAALYARAVNFRRIG